MADKIDSLVEEVGKLTTATTDLINTVNTSKVELDTAVTSATNQATSATNQATVATQQAAKATQQATSASTSAAQAKSAATNAVAVTTGGTASLTAAAGKIPIGNSKGAIDIKWTPLLAAMYPHSGVIGSINKEDLFTFSASKAADANKVTIKASQFNINGRWVSVPLTIITLQEAESTADRAIAFDDIFIDWDGNVQTYRSITPHRTGTGYDRDKIATEHGYTKVQKGLYKSGDTYALLLGRVARRNQAIYHPVFNPEGSSNCCNFYPDYTGNVPYWRNPKYADGSGLLLTSRESCFDKRFYHPLWGVIRTGVTGRPDKKFYDAIYSEDFTPLYYSAKNVVDRQALLFDSFNCAIGGETFSGAEGGITYKKAIYMYDTNNISVAYLVDPVSKNTIRWSQVCSGSWELSLPSGQGHTNPIVPEDILYSPDRYRVTAGYEPNDPKVYMWQNRTIPNGSEFWYKEAQPSACPQPTMSNIIGSLDAMPDLWKTEGIPGNWLNVGEEGESLIPDGTQKNYKLNRKCLDCYQVLMTADKGVTWADVTNYYKNSAEGADNTLGGLSIAANEVWMVSYKTDANPFVLANNYTNVARGVVALITQNYTADRGSVCCSNLLNKVPTGTKYRTTAIENSGVIRAMDLGGWGGATIKHAPIDTLGSFDTATPTAKFYPYLVARDGGVYLQLIYKEMKHNGTAWGDDSNFNIVNQQATVTDLNGEKVIVGQKRVELPYLFDGVTY